MLKSDTGDQIDTPPHITLPLCIVSNISHHPLHTLFDLQI